MTTTQLFGRHGGLARATRWAWQRLPIDLAAKQRLRATILATLAKPLRRFSPNEGTSFHPSLRHGSDPRAFAPPVTVIVPNYNHAPYLRQRLESIYGQTYRNLRVILLDDCSTDGSRAILEEYASRHPEITRLICNTQNSGGVFRQWLRALESAETELVWIAESDDYCDVDFLERLIPFFRDDAVKLAYGHSTFVTEDGSPSGFRFEDYVGELSRTKWRRPYVAAAHAEVAGFLGRKNTIPNVSSAVFRRLDPTRLLMETIGSK